MRAPFWVGIALVAAVMAGQWMVHKRLGVPGPSNSTVYHVAYVYDGDTVKLSDGQHVRLIGIDTPEAHDNQKLSRDVTRRHSSRQKQLAMGQQAMQYVHGWLNDQDVRLEYDIESKDRYGRSLAYLYLTDGTFVNAKIIQDGYAYPLTVPPNVKYAHQFKQWFDEAREQKRGLWHD